MKIISICVLAMVVSLRRMSSIPIDNNVIGDPHVICSGDSVSVQIKTKNPFGGKIFVKGQSANSQCVVDHTGSKNVQNISITVVFGTCNVERYRSVKPKGVNLRSTIVIQFHSHFLTKVDRAYLISCFYQQATKTVTANLDVSMLNTEAITNGYAMPICTYSLHKETATGPLVQYAKVGDPVVHVWQCQHESTSRNNESAYGMLVHSCYVNDGIGGSELVVDDKGCGLDPYILGHLTYSGDVLTASREAHVFKFADHSSLYFTCQIRLCMKTMDACRGMTPPKCSELKNKRSMDYLNSLSLINQTEIEEDLPLMDVRTSRLTVFDNDDENATFPDANRKAEFPEIKLVCFVYSRFSTICFFSLISFVIISFFLSICVIVRRRRLASALSRDFRNRCLHE